MTFDIKLPKKVKVSCTVTGTDKKEDLKEQKDFESSIGNITTDTLRVEYLKNNNEYGLSIRPLDHNNNPIQDPDMFAHLELLVGKSETLFKIITTTIKEKEFLV